MKPRLLLIALLMMALLLPAGCRTRGETAQPGATVEPFGAPVMPGSGEAAFDFTLARLDGGTVTLSDLRGGWVLLNFWATWCPPCVKEMPHLEQLSATYDIAVLGVNMNEARERVAAFVAENGITFPILMDPDDVLRIMYEARALPRTAIVAPDGTVAGIVMGAISVKEMEAWLEEQGVARR